MGIEKFGQPLDIRIPRKDMIIADAKREQNMYNQMMSACYRRCLSSIKDEDKDLTAAEKSCVGRCVDKYAEVGKIVESHLGTVQNDIIAEQNSASLKKKATIGTVGAGAALGLLYVLFQDE